MAGSPSIDDADRFRLLGKYKTPRFRIGQRVLCAVRGDMTITGITEAPIPLPLGKRGRGRHSLIVYKGLEKALRASEKIDEIGQNKALVE